MPVQLTYPGVYIEEIPSGVRTITGVATSITAFLGRARRGTVNEPEIINSFSDFERRFGGLRVDYPMSYAVRDFFLNGGSQAIIIRLVNPNTDGADDATKAYNAAKTVADAAEKGTDVADVKKRADDANTAIQNDSTKSAAEKTAAKKVADAVDGVAGAATATPDSVKKVAKDALPSSPTTKKASKALLRLKTSKDDLIIEAASEGQWGNNLRSRVDYDGIDDTIAERYKPLTKDDLFNITVRDMDTGVTERFLNVTVSGDNPRSLDRVFENESNLVRVHDKLPAARPKKTDDGLTDEEKKITPFSKDDKKRSVGVPTDAAHQEDQGTDGGKLASDDYIGSGLKDNKRGLYSLDKADIFNLLCIPPDDRAGDTPIKVYQEAEMYCSARRAILLVDPPVNWGKNSETAASNAKNGLSTLGLTGEAGRNAAIYFPRVRQSDPQNDGQIDDTFAPCGIIAGIIARTDTQRGVWKAPAGLDASINGIVGLQVNLNDSENGMLNPLGINCLRDLKVNGRVVWGARTLRGSDQLADEWKYIPVRRTALFIEESLYRGLQWVVFEPNDEPLWSQIRLNVGAFMHNLFVQGAFQGRTPREAYFVKCDKETTTQNDINQGIVNVVVGFAPLKPAEFVVIKIQQMAGQIQT